MSGVKKFTRNSFDIHRGRIVISVLLKGAINQASSPVSAKLANLAESKNAINFYNSLPTREGEELTLIGSNREKLAYQWTAYLNKQGIDDLVQAIQDDINATQDEIDTFNAQTQVDFAE